MTTVEILKEMAFTATETQRRALEDAISALSTEGDLISRQAVENITWEEPSYSDPLNVLTEVREKVRALPSVENKGEWIPVSERLPEDHQNILFSTKTDRVFEGRYFKDKTEHQWYSFRDECFAYNNVVTAWQPLPEPYKKGGE